MTFVYEMYFVVANNLIPLDYTLTLNFTTVRVKQSSFIIFSDFFNFTSSWQGPAHPKLIEVHISVTNMT